MNETYICPTSLLFALRAKADRESRRIRAIMQTIDRVVARILASSFRNLDRYGNLVQPKNQRQDDGERGTDGRIETDGGSAVETGRIALQGDDEDAARHTERCCPTQRPRTSKVDRTRNRPDSRRVQKTRKPGARGDKGKNRKG